MHPSRRTRWTAAAAAVVVLALVAGVVIIVDSDSSGDEQQSVRTSSVDETIVRAAEVFDAGALPLGGTAYPVPADAIWVSPSGSDAAPGTEGAPVATLSRAVAIASAGDTIVLREGTYHEDVKVERKPVTIQNAPGEVVWLDGSVVVDGWVPDGDGRWSAPWPYDTGYVLPDSWLPYPNDPAAADPDQIFFDGQQLRQRLDPDTLGPMEFAVDEARDRVWVSSDPTGVEVRAAVLADGLYVRESPGTVVRGIGVRRYATLLTRLAQLKAHSDDMVVENVVSIDSATAGVSLVGDGILLQDTTTERNGQLGVHIDGGTGITVTRVYAAYNNTARFGEGSAEGGIKATDARQLVFSDNLVEYNRGQGLWTDLDAEGITITGNVVRHNGRNGIQYELSADGVIADNVLYDNGNIGIYVVDAGDVEIWNNTLVGHARAISMIEGPRTGQRPSVSGQVEDIEIRNNVMSAGGRSGSYLYGVDDVTRERSGEAMGIVSNDNAFHLVNRNAYQWMIAWASYPDPISVYDDLAAFQRRGYDGRSLEVVGGNDPFVDDVVAGEYGRPAGSPAIDAGAPLSASVAAAVGLPTGATVDIGALMDDAPVVSPAPSSPPAPGDPPPASPVVDGGVPRPPGAPAPGDPNASPAMWRVRADGLLLTHNGAQNLGSWQGGGEVVAAAARPTGRGYWMVDAGGAVQAFGDAVHQGDMSRIPLNGEIVAMAPTASGDGYWLLGADGGVFAFGDARFYGSSADLALRDPVVEFAPTPSGNGYWFVAEDGGVFAFGDAAFHGSAADLPLNAPMVAVTASRSGEGYWLVGADGGVFAYGDAAFLGSRPDFATDRPAIRLRAVGGGSGYYLLTRDGLLHEFGAAPIVRDDVQGVEVIDLIVAS
ncbi:MAG: right-handed parallel beta-helix repeat-containing protein [Actinomycetota bacterium]